MILKVLDHPLLLCGVHQESDFTSAIWRHCLFNFISIAIHRAKTSGSSTDRANWANWVWSAIICLWNTFLRHDWHDIVDSIDGWCWQILCVLLFYYLMKSDIKRGIPQDMLEKYSKRIVFAHQVLASKTLHSIWEIRQKCIEMHQYFSTS